MSKKQLALINNRKHRERRLAPIKPKATCETATPYQIQKIKYLKCEGYSIRQIAKLLNVSRSLVLTVEVKL